MDEIKRAKANDLAAEIASLKEHKKRVNHRIECSDKLGFPETNKNSTTWLNSSLYNKEEFMMIYLLKLDNLIADREKQFADL